MKKAAIFLMVVSVALCLTIYMLYTEDMSRMEKGEPVLFSCWGQEYAPVVDNENNEEIRFEVKADTITARGATINIVNNSDYDISFGEDYVIQKYERGNWKSIDTASEVNDWNDMLYIVESGNPAEIRVYWADKYGELEGGSYRIGKTIIDNYNLSTSYDVYGYFKIE